MESHSNNVSNAKESRTVIDFPYRTDSTAFQSFDPVTAGIIEAEHADRLLTRFRTSFVRAFPFVIPEPDSALLRRQQPFLFHAILAVTSYDTPRIQCLLADDFRRQIASTIEQSRKSLEILQGLLVYAAWYHSFYYPANEQLSIVVQLCVGLVQDLGLSKTIKKRPDPASIFYCNRHSKGDSAARNRAYLGTYFLTVV